MSRIRSIHPGLWTDEAFMALSPLARLLIIGIWTEAYDDGVFDWKPLTLRARIFPVDNVDMVALLDELVAGQFITRQESGDRQVGLVRNFRVFQRPKKPNSSGMLNPEWVNYVGICPDSSEPVPNQSHTSTEKSPQMEDGGWRMKGEVPPRPPKGGGRRQPRGAGVFLNKAQEIEHGQEGSPEGVEGNRPDAGRVPILAIGHH